MNTPTDTTKADPFAREAPENSSAITKLNWRAARDAYEALKAKFERSERECAALRERLRQTEHQLSIARQQIEIDREAESLAEEVCADADRMCAG